MDKAKKYLSIKCMKNHTFIFYFKLKTANNNTQRLQNDPIPCSPPYTSRLKIILIVHVFIKNASEYPTIFFFL